MRKNYRIVKSQVTRTKLQTNLKFKTRLEFQHLDFDIVCDLEFYG